MNIKNVYILEDRGILFISGADTKEFLQNLVSNDINKVNENNSCFASLLTPQGKFLYDFIIIKHKSGYLIDCEKTEVEKNIIQNIANIVFFIFFYIVCLVQKVNF